MPTYDSNRFDPPAPLATVTLRNIHSRATVNDVPMLIDSGSDVTLVPEASITNLGIDAVSDQRVELEGFDGTVATASSVQLDLAFLGVTFRGRFVVTKAVIGILGRNVLNRFPVLLDGPNLNWKELRQLPRE